MDSRVSADVDIWSPPRPPADTGDGPEEAATSGIRLGGAWRNFSERIRALETENAALQEKILFLTEDRDALAVERADMSNRFHDSVASLTQEFSGHLRSLQIIEAIRQEKLSLSENAEAYEELCAKLTKELAAACNEITIVKQECYSWKARSTAKEALLEEEKVETKALRDMMYKKDEQIESYAQRVCSQDADIDTLKRAIVTKDRQLVLLVKERDRYKLELKSVAKKKVTDPTTPEFDNTLSSLSIYDSPTSPTRSPARSPAATSRPGLLPRSPLPPRSPDCRSPAFITRDIQSSPAAASGALSIQVNSSFSTSLETSGREYKAIIRKLRADLDAANAVITSKSVGSSSKNPKKR